VTGPLATRTVKVQRDVIAIAKIFAAMALYPLVWLAIAGLTWRYRGLAWGAAALQRRVDLALPGAGLGRGGPADCALHRIRRAALSRRT